MGNFASMDWEKGKYLEKYLVEQKKNFFWKKMGEFDSIKEAQESIRNYFSDSKFIFPNIDSKKIGNGKIVYDIKWDEANLVKRTNKKTEQYEFETCGTNTHYAKMRITPKIQAK